MYIVNNVLKSIFVIGIFITNAYAYNASCKLTNGKSFVISVHKGIMTVNYKWKASYKKKTWSGWYVYDNQGYKYTLGIFNNGKFPIEVTNKYENEVSIGTCILK